ncbi:hypothetical protein ACFY1A_16945 [Streptomyces sp. NPDC001520]|uniref:hypothetical protein n=1 Tax=Streptomyces sp. NPDC001520 TaxID=3364581 RepID=UPI00369F4E37
MPKNDLFGQGVQYPALSDVPDIETALGGIVNGLVGRTVLRFANANARAAALTGSSAPVPGMITYLVAEDRYDARMADGTWQPLSPGPWKPLSLSTGMVTHSGNPGYSLTNGMVSLRGRLARSNGGQYTTGTTWQLATLPSAYRPTANMYMVTPIEIGAGIYYGRTEILTTGEINVITPPGSTSTVNGMHWTGLDGLSYSL